MDKNTREKSEKIVLRDVCQCQQSDTRDTQLTKMYEFITN